MRLIFAALLASTLALSAATTLDIYFIDVEGGQATLIVTPAGESLLVDTGYAGSGGRDAGRIMAAARAAGIKQINYLVITHFHPDHDGGVVELAQQIPIRTFVDHGGFAPEAEKAVNAASTAAYQAYLPVRAKGKHINARPGDRLPMKGLEVVVVSSGGATIAKPMSGASSSANPACATPTPDAGDRLENPRSTGFHLRFGQFRFIDLGDLTGPPLYALVCPDNKLGGIDVYLVPHHGGDDVAHPSLVAALRPRVAVVNNGETKGGGAKMFAMLRSAAGLEDVWQLHRSRNAGVENVADERIANVDETTGHWIKLSASEDGSFRMTNQRTGATKTYPRRNGR